MLKKKKSHVAQPQTQYVAEDNPASRMSPVYLPDLPGTWITDGTHNAQPTNLVFWFLKNKTTETKTIYLAEGGPYLLL